MFERFTDRARRVIVLAQEEARSLGHNYIGTEHLLLGLIAEGEGVGAKALEDLGLSHAAVRGEIEQIIGTGGAEVPEGHIPFTPRSKKSLELALREALQLGHDYIGTEHILLGLAREGEGVATQILDRLGGGHPSVRAAVVGILTGHRIATTPRHGPAGVIETGRYSPGLAAALEAAAARASSAPAVGTHHLLSVLAEWDDLAAHQALRAGGFDPSRLEVAIHDWDVGDTRDETEEQLGVRTTEISAEEDAIVVRLVDPELRVQIRQALDSERSDEVKAAFGRAIRDLQRSLPRRSEEQEPGESPAS
jgi:ATP-dependent Clp protease ATP-binding subunit ClpA